MANIKPLLEELKSLKDNINTQNIKSLLQTNFQENRDKIEAKLVHLAETTKNNPVVNEYVEQVLKAELTNQALTKLQEKFPDHDIVKKILEVKSMLLKEEQGAEDIVQETKASAESELAQEAMAGKAPLHEEGEEVEELETSSEPTKASQASD